MPHPAVSPAADREDAVVTAPFVLLVVAGLAVFIAMGITLPVLPRHTEGALGGSKAAVGLVVGSFSLSAVLVRPVAGWLADRWGRRPPMVAGAALMAVSLLGYAAASSVATLVLARLVTGLGEAVFFVAAMTVVTELAPAHRRGEALSYFSVAIYLGLGIGPLVGEVVADGGTDRAWLVAAGAAGAAALLATAAPETRSGPASRTGPLISRTGVRVGTTMALGVMGFIAFSAFVPLYTDELGLAGAGPLFLCYSGIVLTIRILGARIPDTWGPARTGTTALSAMTVGLVTMGLWRSVPGLWVGTAVLSVGMALLYPALMSLAVASAPASERSAVVGTVTGFFDLAQGLGGLLLGVVAGAAGIPVAFVVAGTLAATGIGVLRGWALPRG